MKNDKKLAPWREHWYRIIFEADTKKGKLFDVFLLLAISLSVITIMLETVTSIRADLHHFLYLLEWIFTALFSLEYLMRMLVVRNRWKYFKSFYGIIDLVSVLPSYFSFFLGGAQYIMMVRSLRLLRVFRILKLMRFMGEANSLRRALIASRHKITIFVVTVICLTFITGTTMYLVEGAEHGFTDIPTAVYWSIVTLTTVGYGDISPQTPLGQFIASFIMIMGYGIIAIPTGIVTAELSKRPTNSTASKKTTTTCQNCGKAGHRLEAKYCDHCGKLIS